MMTVRERLIRARKRQELTKQQVADQLHVARQTISSWETGRSYPDITSLIALSELYHDSLDQLIKGDPGMMDDLKKKEAELKQAKMVHWASIVIDFGLIAVVMLGYCHVPYFDLGTGQIISLDIILLINLVVMLTATKRYRDLTGKAQSHLKPTKCTVIVTLLAVVVLALTGLYLKGWAYLGGLLTGMGMVCVITWLVWRFIRLSK